LVAALPESSEIDSKSHKIPSLPKIKQPGDLAKSGSGIIKEELEDMLTNAHTAS